MFESFYKSDNLFQKDLYYHPFTRLYLAYEFVCFLESYFVTQFSTSFLNGSDVPKIFLVTQSRLQYHPTWSVSHQILRIYSFLTSHVLFVWILLNIWRDLIKYSRNIVILKQNLISSDGQVVYFHYMKILFSL